uniref:Acylphosphatase-like domain-containing protein n=1 Tax=Toxoplasma gondii TgCATBr9 TaxID=943120 RepID=A0A2T6IZR7_TOXGO|nr:hypothetical protein TGBR9_249790 [Toxoplasma gondii TgCATBr9]
MAPFPRGIVKPRSAKVRAILNLSVEQRQPNPLRAPRKSLLDPPPCVAPLEKGNPKLDRQFDTLNRSITGFRKYKAPHTTAPRVVRDRDETNFHEMLGKFRFDLQGSFKENGDMLRDSLLQVGRDLFLVGWVKCRSRFATGHIQGDVHALSYMRRYLEKHVDESVSSVRFYEENFGMPLLEYERLSAVNDFRAPGKKQQHALRAAEKNKAKKLEQESLHHAQELERFYEENCIRNY